MLDTLNRNPGGPAFIAALDLVDRASDTLTAVCDALMRIPPNAVPLRWVARAVMRLPKSDQGAVAVLDKWETSDVAALKNVVSRAREAQSRSGQR
ncbi:hypothetical protein [Kibdelosporangium philippinense]|uniref:hypothetical protein n=1 Tax=Kibdelosporangium philippinense TaxID=211113 RepID=UPI00362203D5